MKKSKRLAYALAMYSTTWRRVPLVTCLRASQTSRIAPGIAGVGTNQHRPLVLDTAGIQLAQRGLDAVECSHVSVVEVVQFAGRIAAIALSVKRRSRHMLFAERFKRARSCLSSMWLTLAMVPAATLSFSSLRKRGKASDVAFIASVSGRFVVARAGRVKVVMRRCYLTAAGVVANRPLQHGYATDLNWALVFQPAPTR
jgi:hypothetical protein